MCSEWWIDEFCPSVRWPTKTALKCPHVEETKPTVWFLKGSSFLMTCPARSLVRRHLLPAIRELLPVGGPWWGWEYTFTSKCAFVTPLCVSLAVLGIISTVWFPVGAHHDGGLMSFGFSLYAGWVGSSLCLLGGLMILFCHANLTSGLSSRDASFYYSRRGGADQHTPDPPPANHAKTARVWTPGALLTNTEPLSDL